MQRATITGTRVRSPSDARVIFHAVHSNILPMVTRRLDNEERSMISSGSVYVWEERGPHAELTGVGIERWTDGIRWGPSRVREGFLFYSEKLDVHSQHLYAGESHGSSSSGANRGRGLVKQTYTVFVETPAGQRKWHLIAYFTEASVDRLRSVDDFPQLTGLTVPPGKYRSARSSKGRPECVFQNEREELTISEVIFDHSQTSSLSPSPTRLKMNDYPSLPPLDSSKSSVDYLAPLEYLENLTPPRRHPMDEGILKLLSHRLM